MRIVIAVLIGAVAGAVLAQPDERAPQPQPRAERSTQPPSDRAAEPRDNDRRAADARERGEVVAEPRQPERVPPQPSASTGASAATGPTSPPPGEVRENPKGTVLGGVRE